MQAFAYSPKLETFAIPDSITSIGAYAFEDCSAMTYNKEEGGKVLYLGNEENEYLVLVGVDDTDITSYTVNPNCKVIADIAFMNCKSLTDLTLSNNVEIIGNGAFNRCEALTALSIPASVKKIGSSILYNCKNLTSITVDPTNTVYDSRNDCKAIIHTATETLHTACKDTTIPAAVTTIGSYAYAACREMTTITIPSTITKIGENAFCGMPITSIVIPNSVTELGFSAFWGVRI